VASLAQVVERVAGGELSAVGVDIPIGLASGGYRQCDRAARALLGPRRSSVFPAPVRGVLRAETWEEALHGCRELAGHGLSRQAYGILAKVREADELLDPDVQRKVVEVHPEVSFTLLSGSPMRHHKSSPLGRAERLASLERVFGDVGEGSAARLPGARPDDVLDAYAVLWSARRFASAKATRLGDGRRDSRGLRMEIVA
jgi:predicted RNase H-like nuclease